MTKPSSKRRDKSKQKRNRKRQAAKKKTAAKREKARLVQKNRPLMEAPEYVYWIMHGCNFLVSDYDEGIWDPIFPEIYEGNHIPRAEDVAERILRWFKDKPDDILEKLVIGWSAQPIKTVHIYYLGSVKAARDANPGKDAAEVLEQARKPMSAAAWQTFNMLKADMTARMMAREEADMGLGALPPEGTCEHGVPPDKPCEECDDATDA